MDPCGTPEIISKISLIVPLMFTYCLLFLKYEKNRLSVFSSNPYASNLASNKSCGKQSNAFERSINSAPTTLF